MEFSSHLGGPLMPVSGQASDPTLITVITPACNVEAFIAEALESVLSQSHSNIEYLVVDDGSTDATAEIVESFMKSDQRLRLIRNEHKGGSAARNTALAQAKGAFIAFLDGDDRWRPTFLRDNLALLNSLPKDVAAVFCRPRVITEGGRPYLVRWEKAGGYDFDGMIAAACPPKCGSTLLLKREAFRDSTGFSELLSSAVDLDMWLRIQRDSGMGVFWANPAYLADQRIRAGAISRNHNKRFEALDYILDTYSVQMKRLSPSAAYVRPAVFAFRSGDDQTALRWAGAARKAGLIYLVRDLYGLRMLGWTVLGESGRNKMRKASNAMRKVLGHVLDSGRALAR